MLTNAFENLSVESEQEQQSLLLRSILDRLGFIDPTTGAQRVFVANTGVNVTGSLTGVTTVSTVSNTAAVGGLLANADQYVQMQVPYSAIRSRITLT